MGGQQKLIRRWDVQTAELILLEQEEACELQLDERIRERVSPLEHGYVRALADSSSCVASW